jgi:hypothetical protein
MNTVNNDRQVEIFSSGLRNKAVLNFSSLALFEFLLFAKHIGNFSFKRAGIWIYYC